MVTRRKRWQQYQDPHRSSAGRTRLVPRVGHQPTRAAPVYPNSVPKPSDTGERAWTWTEPIPRSSRQSGRPGTSTDEPPATLNPRIRGSDLRRRTCPGRPAWPPEITSQPDFFMGATQRSSPRCTSPLTLPRYRPRPVLRGSASRGPRLELHFNRWQARKVRLGRARLRESAPDISPTARRVLQFHGCARTRG